MVVLWELQDKDGMKRDGGGGAWDGELELPFEVLRDDSYPPSLPRPGSRAAVSEIM